MFEKKNYKVGKTVGHKSIISIPVAIVIETGAGPNLIDSQLLLSNWKGNIKTTDDPGLNTARR